MKFGYCILTVIMALEANSALGDKSFSFNISTHILDTHKGRPASGVPVTLYKLTNVNVWISISEGKTAVNGRYAEFSSTSINFTAATYKLHFDVKEYYSSTSEKTLYPAIDIIFDVDNANEHYHIPLLLNAYGYTTYRGS